MNNLSNTRRKIAVLGGDLRSLLAARALTLRGYDAAVWGFDTEEARPVFDSDNPSENINASGGVGSITRCSAVCDALGSASAILLPLPVSSDGVRLNTPLSSRELKLCDLFPLLASDIPIMGGLVSDSVRSCASDNKLHIIDYYDREELCVQNAVPTAEGAIAIAINELPITLSGANAVVLGFGRIARVLCASLKALGANVTACARKPADFAWMRVMGINPAHIQTLESDVSCGGIPSGCTALKEADVVFNTVPAKLLGCAALSLLKKGTPVIDLASKPGGVDFEAARTIGTNVIWALSLPGKTAPVTAGEIICSTVLTIMEEYGIG